MTASFGSATHTPWLGDPKSKVRGNRLLIVGYSHYVCKSDFDNPAVTCDVIRRVVSKSGEEQKHFWRQIPQYFRHEDQSDFWRSVGFMNYAPQAIGSEDDKYRAATRVELVNAPARLLSSIRDQGSDFTFVFSTKAAWDIRSRVETLRSEEVVIEDQIFHRLVVPLDGKERHVVLGPHPQGAKLSVMQAMVDKVLANA